jgi:hypothetical protein
VHPYLFLPMPRRPLSNYSPFQGRSGREADVIDNWCASAALEAGNAALLVETVLVSSLISRKTREEDERGPLTPRCPCPCGEGASSSPGWTPQ